MQSAPASPAKLLIVDDELELLSLLKDIFEGLGYEIATAADGFEALKVTHVFHPDAILCDVAMPGMDGIDFLLELRNLDNHVPVVLLTGHADKSLAIRALKHGAFDFHEKPFQYEALSASIAQALAFGIELRTVERELDEICARKTLNAEDLDHYRAIQRLLLRNRKQMSVLLKKAG